jgi:hypothetical protein
VHGGLYPRNLNDGLRNVGVHGRTEGSVSAGPDRRMLRLLPLLENCVCLEGPWRSRATVRGLDSSEVRQRLSAGFC